ncbi:MAG: MBL fold metallo-hydrolase [Desulfuromonas sp.]|nr:MBL fold metallo-hydrolase [Desulfuromonas sp.]
MNLDNIHCIDLDQPQLPGFRQFISAWLIAEEHFSAVVDPGPLSTIPVLIQAMQAKGIKHLDYILLTHIHIDHAGGTGELLKYFPEAQVICHPDGITHMIAPQKLWQGSLQVLGDMAQIYGKIIAVSAKNISFSPKVGDTGIEVYKTPGHAAHHQCFKYADLLFGGEVCGVTSAVATGIYMRPATPPRFMLPIALDSIDRMIALKPLHLVIAHYGLVKPALEYLRTGRKQLILWLQAVAATYNVASADREQAFFDWLIEHDVNFSNITQLDEDIRQRELRFLGNTLRGMLGYYRSLDAHQQQEFILD